MNWFAPAEPQAHEVRGTWIVRIGGYLKQIAMLEVTPRSATSLGWHVALHAWVYHYVCGL